MKKKHYIFSFLIPIVTVLAGCSTFTVPRYTSSPNVAYSLNKLHKKYPNSEFTVGHFTQSVKNAGSCRMAGPVVTPDNQSYSGYMAAAFTDELKLASMYTKSGGIAISGKLNKADFSSNTGTWNLNVKITIQGQAPLVINENYDFRTSFAGWDACNEVAQAYEAAVQDVISKVISSSQFHNALKTQSTVAN